MINNDSIKLYVNFNEKFGFIGDIHFADSISSRLDDYMHTCCQKLFAIGDICQKEHVRYLFFSGDVFHKVTCTHECVNKLGNVLLSLQKQGIRMFSIFGNHDLLRNSLQPSSLARTPLQILFDFNILEHINLSKPVEIYRMGIDDFSANSVKITAVDYTEKIPPADRNFDNNILMAHMFFDQKGFLIDEDENISSDQMKNYGYDMAFLGHDHEEHSPSYCGKTVVIRCGSLLRGSVHDYNFKREPGFVIVDDIFNLKHIRKVVVPHHPYQDIISQSALNKKVVSKSEAVNINALQNLAEKLAKTNERDEISEDVILNTIKTDFQIPNNRRKLLLRYINMAE